MIDYSISAGEDIIDEALYYFKANTFFRSYEIKVRLNYLIIATKVGLAVSDWTLEWSELKWSKENLPTFGNIHSEFRIF